MAEEVIDKSSIIFSKKMELLIDESDPITKKVKIPAKIILII